MKIQDKLENELVSNGLWPDEAKKIIAEFKIDKDYQVMSVRWERAADEYPPQMLAVLLTAVKIKALNWIDRKKPEHFARDIISASISFSCELK